MCGIAGLFSRAGSDLEAAVGAMTACLRHRGPDAAGIWCDRENGLALGHARLAIVELSELGAQPMQSAHARFVISYNGEIYNFRDLAVELRAAGHKFQGGSDTEVMLAAFEEWGVEEALKRFNGMFAFALWDRSERRLFLGRDRTGKKPLYYGWTKAGFVFASELKALKSLPAFAAEIDRESISIQLRHNYIPAPWSIYRGIYKLPCGSFLSVSAEQAHSRPTAFEPQARGTGSTPGPRFYWSVEEIAERSAQPASRIGEREAAEELEKLLRDAVAIRMISDVPLGAFLSGGTDSSLVVALMQQASGRKVETFAVGFDEETYNEADDAAAVAKCLGTNHHELRVTAADALKIVPRLPSLYDEPFSDSSQIPTFLISEFARKSVTVALSGDGGDECFCGYNRYSWAKKIWRFRSLAPWPLHALAGRTIRALSPHTWDRLGGLFSRADGQTRRFGHRMYRMADFLQADDPAHLYQVLISHWESPGGVVLGGVGARDIIRHQRAWNLKLDYERQMMLVDQKTYLPGDILTKVDRASMGVSLEARAPLLDYRIIELTWRLPLSLLIRDGVQKWLLKQLLYKYVPKKLVERPKMGFGVPIQQWLAGPLREWAADLLNVDSMRREGYLNADLVQSRWVEFLSGRRPWDQHLWDVLMFQSWLGNFHHAKGSEGGSSRVLPLKRAG